MAITLNKYSNRFDMLGDRIHTGYLDISFDSSYAYGGESIAAGLAKLGFKTIYSITAQPKIGYIFVSDITNEKLKVLNPSPPVVIHEEYVIVTSNVGYLKWPAAHINYIAGCTTAHTPINSKIPIAGGVTPAAGQCAVDLGYNDTTGVLYQGQRTSLTFLAADAIVGCYVSYVTQAWKDVAENMSMAKMTSGVQTYGDGLTFTAGTPDNVKLGTDIVAMQSITWSDGGDAGTIKVPELLADGGAPAATLETEIDFVKATTFGEVNHYATDAVDTTGDIVRYVYIKHPGAGTYLGDRFTNATIADSSDTITYTGTPLIYGHCGQTPMTTSDKQAIWVAVADAVAARQIHWTTHPWGYAGCALGAAPIATMEGTTDDDNVPAWINGNSSELEIMPLQVPGGTNLSGLTNIRVIVTGILKN